MNKLEIRSIEMILFEEAKKRFQKINKASVIYGIISNKLTLIGEIMGQ